MKHVLESWPLLHAHLAWFWGWSKKFYEIMSQTYLLRNLKGDAFLSISSYITFVKSIPSNLSVLQFLIVRCGCRANIHGYSILLCRRNHGAKCRKYISWSPKWVTVKFQLHGACQNLCKSACHYNGCCTMWGLECMKLCTRVVWYNPPLASLQSAQALHLIQCVTRSASHKSCKDLIQGN